MNHASKAGHDMVTKGSKMMAAEVGPYICLMMWSSGVRWLICDLDLM